jgi:hypothetical protein
MGEVGERNSIFVFKGPTEGAFRYAMVSAVAQLGGRLVWDQHPDPMEAKLLTSHKGAVHAAYIHFQDHEVAKRVGISLDIPWINVRIQEGSLWDYSLYRAESHLDNFSTFPEYWDDDEEWIATQRGRPELLARTWGVEQSTIENYLMPWGMDLDEEEGIFRTRLRGKAYPTDQHEYGDIWQMTDFLRALGAHDPNWSEPHSIPRLLEDEPKAYIK